MPRDDSSCVRSATETFAALRVTVDNERWRGVPFLLRTAKAMAADRRTVTIALRPPERELLEAAASGTDRPNEIVLELSDDPQLRVDVHVKVPGQPHPWYRLHTR